eukprot:CAMPEP_0178496490 /NCGR_PEP_ID=MMETSP0696-20121128/14145_1 /TAXON_ID=265572 /ORGANISM="Extubocellulus spinifer, Strain CCMP396" /LENGTH=34 /DNA_ID= /DNA_START= /DNA_END= /DNA_ORIENTATION=
MSKTADQDWAETVNLYDASRTMRCIPWTVVAYAL